MMKPLNILISNDDGIEAEGIRRLAEALKDKGNIYVVAPDTQRSASSHCLSIHDELVLTEVENFPAVVKAWKLSGSPADCVKVGYDILRKQGIDVDIVYTGINHGANLATDTVYSGTVSAAAEGVFLGLPAVAVSVCDHYPEYFEGACNLAAAVFERALETKGRGCVVSLNAPNLPLSEIKGVKTARLGTLTYHDWFEETAPGVLRYAGAPVFDRSDEPDSDVYLTRNGWATIAMVKYDLNDYESLKMAEEWRITL